MERLKRLFFSVYIYRILWYSKEGHSVHISFIQNSYFKSDRQQPGLRGNPARILAFMKIS